MHRITATVTSGTSGQRVVYTPDPGWTGADTVSYTLADGHGGTVDGTLRVVTPVSIEAVTIDAYGPPGTPIALDLRSAVVDRTHTGLVFSASDPRHGTVVVTGSQATYVPDPGYAGPDRFTFTATDPAGRSASATVSVRIG
jgi:hypothetical protein